MIEEDKKSDKVILLGLFLVLEDKYQEWKTLFIHNSSNTEIVESEDGLGFELFDKIYKKSFKKAIS